MEVGEGQRDVLDTTRAGNLIIRGGVVRGGGFVLSTLLALLGVALVTRHLGVDDFGRFQTVISLITVVGTVTDAGLGTLGLREYSQRFGRERDGMMRALLGLRGVLTLIGTLISAGIAAAIGYDTELILGTLLAGIGLALLVVQTTLTIPLAAALQNVSLTAIDLLRQVLTVGGYVLLVVVGAGVTAFLGVTIPVGVAVVAAAAVLAHGRIPLRPSLRAGEWLGLVRAGVAFAMATAVGTIYLYTAQILTAAVTDSRETGLFSASFRVFVVAVGIPALLISVAFPLLSRAASDDHVRLAYAVQRIVDTTSILGFGAALGLVVGAPAIIDVMAGSGFADAVPALRIQGATLAVTFILAPLGFALLSLHRHREILIANCAALVVMLTAVTALASELGSEGAALGTVIGETTLCCGYLLALRRTAPEILPEPSRAARALVAVAPCFAVLLIDGLASWIAAGIALAAYALLLVLVRAIPDELIEVVKRS
jgi:O-antigen/teichoic acid export membrane protein